MKKPFGFFISLLIIIGIVACSDSQSGPRFNFMPAKDGLAAKVGDIQISVQELDSGIESEIYEAEKKLFDIRFNRLKSLVLEKLMEQDPNKKDLSNDEYLDKYIASSIKITDKQVEDFIKEKNIPKEHVNPQIKERIKSFLVIEQKKDAIDAWLAKKTSKTGIQVFIPKPQRPSFDVKVGDSFSKGPESAPITIVEFSDFQCPFCKKAADTVDEVVKKYGNKVRVVFKHYPLPFHKFAKKASEAAMCAGEQNANNFWKMHDKMFNNQDALEVSGLKKMAGELKLDQKKFDECLDSAKFASNVEADMNHGQELGVKSTPTFFINGKLLSGAQPLEEFVDLIEEELK
jgi:protein-disulfide isomerase